MASSVAVVRKGRKHKMRLMTENSDDQMVVKSLSVPPGLEALMEGLTREVLRMQPQDICLFASEHFAKLIKMREATGDEYQFCKTTIHDKIKQKTVPSRVTTQQNQQPCPKDDVETFDGTSSAPRLDFGRLTNGVSPEIKRNISEASTAEIDKLQAGFFNAKPDVKTSEEHANTDDAIVNNKEQENATITDEQVRENEVEADDVKKIEPTEHDDSETSKTEQKDDYVKEVNEELAKSKENVESNTVEEDTAKKENQIQEETEVDKVNDKEVCANVEKDEIPNEEGNVEQKEESTKEVTAHDKSEEPKTINITNEVEPVHKENEESVDNIEEHLAATDKEELNETEKKDTGNNVEDAKLPEEADSNLEANEEHDDLSDSNDVVTQETEQEMKTMSPADKVQISPVEENTDEVEDKPVPSNDTEVKPLEDSTEAKLVDEKHEGDVEDKRTENESHTGLEKAVINDEKDLNKTAEHNSMVEDIKTDGEHKIRKRSVSQVDEHEVHSLTIPEISTTVATPTPSEDGSTSADTVPKELDDINLTGDDSATEEEKQIKAATKLQSLWRGYSLRKMRKSAIVDNEETSEDLHKLTAAATVIQALWRGHSFRKSQATGTPADEAENINLDETSPDKKARDVTDEQNIAATKIQSSWRGHNVRKKRHIDMNDIASDGGHDKTAGEEKPGEEVVNNDSQEIAKEVMAATVIQALWRGYAMRKSRNQESANESTQRNSDVDIGKLNLAAAKIQSLWRGHNSRKLKSSSTIVEHEMSVKEMENISGTSEQEKEQATHALTGDSESKTDTNIIESDKPESEAEKLTEVSEPTVESEKATETESEHIVQPSDSEGNVEQNTIVPELGSDRINDTVEPKIEAVKASDVESVNIAETTGTEGNIEGATKNEKTADANEHTEEVDSVSKTDADVPELQNETAGSEKTTDENTETTENNDEPKSEVQSDEIDEKSELVVKPEEIVKTDEGEVKSEEDAEQTGPIAKTDETEGEVQSEEVAAKTEPAAKTYEAEGQVKSEEVSEKVEPVINAEEIIKTNKDEVTPEEVAEKSEPVVNTDDEAESQVKLEELAEKSEPALKTDEAESEVKSEEIAEKVEPAVKADETESEVKSEEGAGKSEPAVKADETESEVKSEEVSELSEPVIKANKVEGEIESEVKTEDAEKPEPAVKVDETEGQVKSEEDTEIIEPAVKVDETEGEVKLEDVEKIIPAVKADETEGEVKSEEVTEKAEPALIADAAESEIISEEISDKSEPAVKADEAEGQVKPIEVTEKAEPVVKADETEGEVKPEVVEPVVKEEVNVETAEPEIKSDEFTETSESVVKPEEIVEATKTDGEAQSENIAELAAPAESKDVSETNVNDVTPGEISEPEVKAEELADNVEPSVVDETTETGELSVSDKDAPETNNSLTAAEEVIDSTVVKPDEIANITKPVLKNDEISEITDSEAKDTDPEKTVESETDAEKNEDLHEGESVPVSENITKELVDKVESSPIETKNENNSVEKTELHSNKEIDSAGSEVKETAETHAIDNNVNELDEAKTISDTEKVSETTENDKEKSSIIPRSENNTSDTENVKSADITDKTEAGDNVEIAAESPENTTITTPSEDTQSEVEHASEITKTNDNLSIESPEIAASDAAAENKEPESTVTTNEVLKEQSTTISEDSSEEKSAKLDENTGVVVEDNSEQDKLTNSTDNDETNKDVTVNTGTSEITATQGTKNAESDENEQVETKENMTKTLSPHLVDDTQVDVDKHDEVTEPEIKKESVEANEASPVDARPSNQEENETGTTNNMASDKSSDEEKMNETDKNSTNNSITDIPGEPAESSEVTNENKSDIPEPEKQSTDDDQSLVKTEHADHVGTPTEVQCPEISNNGASATEATDDGKQDVPDEKAGPEDPVNENDAATKIQSTWRGYSVRKSNSIIGDTAKSEKDNETEENVEKPEEDTGRKIETNEDEVNKPIVNTAEKAVEELGTAEKNINESPTPAKTVENVPDEAAKEDVATEISEPVAEKIEHSSVNSENINEAGTNDASEINKGETVSAEENNLEDTNHEAVSEIKTAEAETGEHVSDTIGNKEDTSVVPASETVQQEMDGKFEEASPNSTDNKAENVESGDKLEDDLEKHVETTNVEHDAKVKEENVTDSRAEDHKDTYQASEASTVDIKDVEDSLKSPTHVEDGNDLEFNVHEDGEKLNESSDTKNSLDADNKVKFYVGPDESNRIQIVEDETKETDNLVTEPDKPAADEVTNEKSGEIRKSVTSVLLTALSDDSGELEKGEAIKETNEADEHQNDGTNNASTVNSSVPNAEENPPENTEDAKENPTENVEGENIKETQDNQDQNSIHNNIENHTVKSAENVSNIENNKSDVNHDDDKEKLAMNVQKFDNALSDCENKEKELNNVQADVADESVTHTDDTEDTTSVADTQNASTIPPAYENAEKTADADAENNTATETVNIAPLAEEQHAENSENKSDSVQNEDSDLPPTNLHEDKSSESATKDSNDAETTQDTAEDIVSPVEQHENVQADEATTHTLLNTTAKDIAHKSPSDIVVEGTSAADKGNNENESEEKHEVLDTPGTTTTEEMEIRHESSSTVNNEGKHSEDKVDNDDKNVEDGILHESVDMPHESESKSSASVNDTDNGKNIELDETHAPVVSTTENIQNESNEEMEHLKEKDTNKNIEENESEKLDETSVPPSTEDIKDESTETSEHSEENKNHIKKNSEENEYVTADSNNTVVEPTGHDKDNQQLDATEHKNENKNDHKDAKENINEESTVNKNENALISNEDTHSEVNDIEEAIKLEDKPEDDMKIKDIESQIEHDTTDDDAGTKQNDGATENEAHNTAPEEYSPPDNEKSLAVIGDENKTVEDKAAVKIQSAWKGYHVRHGLNEDKELAVLQQPAECDELPSKTHVAEDADVLSQAATTIQAGARGYLVRKRRHLAKITDVPSAKADSTTVDESDSTSQETVIEKHADILDNSQSFGSTEMAKSEEENAHDGTPKEETQSNQEESKSTITSEGTKDVESNSFDAEKSKADTESITENVNDKTMKETESKDVDNEKANVTEPSAEINESLQEHTHKEEETTNNNDKQELDEIDALNLRLRNLNRSNVYQTDEERELDDKVEEDHKTNSPQAVKMNFDRALSDLHAQTSKSSDDDDSVMTAPSNTDDSHNDDASKPAEDKELEGNDKSSHEEPDAEHKEVAQILAEPKVNTTPRLSVNLDDFDSSKYDLKVEHVTPRSKNTSPVHELTSAAYKIGAAIAVDNEAIMDAMDENAKAKSEEKQVEYIHIPLQGALPERIEEKPIVKETLKSTQEHVTSDKNKDDGESPEYIYIPLKPPGTVDEEDEGSAAKESVGDDDNQKEMKNETNTISQSPREKKDDSEDNLKEKLSVLEPTEKKEDSVDTSNNTRAVLEDKAKEDHNSHLQEQEHADAKENHESLTDHVIEKEGDNETEQITKLPEPIPLMNKSSEPLSEAKSTEPDLSPELELSQGKSYSEILVEKSPELSDTKPTDSVVSEEPIEKLTAVEDLEKHPPSETRTPEPELLESKTADSTVSVQSTENVTTEDKSLVEHASAEPELSENKSVETVSSEMKNAEPELSDNKSPAPVLSETKASDALLSAKSKTPEPVNSEQDEKTRTPSPGKSTSPIDDIDAFLQRNKSRTFSRQQNVDSSSHRTLFAEIDSLIDAYGQKRQMSPTSNDHPDLAAAKIENESHAQGQQLSVQADLPDVIMANSNSTDLAATKIQSAYRGHHTRHQLKQQQGANRLDEAQPRKNSEESDKTYTIDKHSQDNASTPDEEVSSDDDGQKNKAATKIQTTFREYRKKRSIEQKISVEEESHGKETAKEDVIRKESVEHSNKMSEDPNKTSEQGDKNKEMEESIENSENLQQATTSVVNVNDESVQENTSPSESVNVAKVTTHNTDGEEDTADSLKVQQPHAEYDRLNSEPERRRHSPERGQVQDLKIAKLEDKFLDHVVTNDSGSDAQHEQLRDISEITHDAAIKIQSTYRGFKTRQTLKNNNQVDGSLETIPEVMSPTNVDKEDQGKIEHGDEETMNEHLTDHAYGTMVQPRVQSCEDVDVLSRQKSAAEQKYKSTPHDVASTSDEWRYRLMHDATTEADSTTKEESESHSSSPDGKLVQGYHHNHHHQHAEQPEGLQHSGDMHDTLDIFLSSEELSQAGAEVLTSRDTSTKGDVSEAHAQCGTAAKHEATEQHDGHSVMESAKTQSKNNTPTTQHNEQQQHQVQQQQQPATDMGNDEAVAATKIQAGFRGYQVRKQMKMKKNASDDAKMVKRCSSGRRRGSLRRGDNSKSGTDLEERSATKIQAGIRGFLVRKRQKSTKDTQ